MVELVESMQFNFDGSIVIGSVLLALFVADQLDRRERDLKIKIK